MKNNWKRIVASTLIMAMFFTSTSMESLAAEADENSPPPKTEADVGKKQEANQTISKENVIESEKTEDSTTYDVGDGVLVTEFYGQDVRFRNENGELIDYDPSLKEIESRDDLEGYAYENAVGDKKQYFPANLTEETPILMEKEGSQIRLVPVEDPAEVVTMQGAEEANATVSESVENEVQNEEAGIEEYQIGEISSDESQIAGTQIDAVQTSEASLATEAVTDIYEETKNEPVKAVYGREDGKASFQYTSLDNGIKEEIVLTEKPGKNTFSFLLEVPGMTIRKNPVGEGLTIYKDNVIAAFIQEPNMNDASGDAYTEDLSYSLETLNEEEGKYLLTLTASEEYLEDEERQYPVTIDPTLVWNDNSRISDVYVLSSYPNYNYYVGGITSFYLGNGKQGISRTYLALGDLSSISKRYIKRATLSVVETGVGKADRTVRAFRVTSDWAQNTISWNSQPGFDGNEIGRFNTKGAYQTDTLDVTRLMQGYADRNYSNYGILLMKDNEGAANTVAQFFGVRHATANYRPKLTVEYYDRPAKAVSVKLEPEYIKPGEKSKIEWSGITAGDLSYIQYRAVEYDEKNNKELSIETNYSGNTKIGTTANGSADVTVGKDVSEGAYKTYKVGVRGVGSSGAVGDENWKLLKVDNAPPKGTIKVLENGTSQEVNVLRDTVEIVGEVDGTGSPIKSSSMKLYDSKGNVVKDIYTNSTLSKIQTVFTPELENGTYTLKMTMEDSVGFTAECEKQVTVVNKLAAPVLKPVISNQSNVEIEWEFPYASAEVNGMAYKLLESTEWITIDGVTGTSGKLAVSLPEAEGNYDVTVCGVDAAGGRGAEAVVHCTIDKTPPRAEITDIERGLLFGTIADDNLSGWEVTLRQEGSTEAETVLQGQKAIEDGYIGFFDMSEMEEDVPYELCLKVTDKAGNVSSVVKTITTSEEDILAKRIIAQFYVKRPDYTAHSASHIVFPANVEKLELAKWPVTDDIPVGDTKWYCDERLVSSEKTWNKNLPSADSGTHSILAVITKDNQFYYSRNIIKNRELMAVKKGETVNLPKGCVSFRLNTRGTQSKANITIDGTKIVEATDGETIYIAKLNSGSSATASSIKIEPVNASEDTSRWILELDCTEEETFELSEAENYHPYEAGVKDKLNYKTYLRWRGVSGTWPQQVSYEIYRGQEEGFTPSEENRIASDVKANYWAEMNVNYSRRFYYRIRAVEKDASGNVIRASSYSNEIDSTVIDADEYVKRMGLKEYWEYAEFDTPSGDGNIEKSRGNLVYIQADAEIPNEKLPVKLERTYNSLSSEKTAFGVGWTHSFDMELLNICKNDSLDFKNIVLKDGNGTLFFFNRKDDGSYTSSMGKYINLKKESKTEEVELPDKEIGVKDKKKKVKVVSEFTMDTKDNVQYRFNSGGQLIYMSEANGNFLLFEYEPDKGLLSKITTSKNLAMEFVYYSEKDYEEGKARPDVFTVKELRLPDGSKVSYQYTDSRLSGVTKTGTDKSSTLHWTMEYNDSQKLVNLSDACGNQYQIDYDGEKANKVTYPNGEAISLKYDVASNRTTTYKEVTENGKTTKILLEVNIFEPSSGNSIQMIDNSGNSVTYEYVDNLLSKTTYSMIYQELEDQKVVQKSTEKTEVKKYSSRENVTEETDEDGVKSTYTYNENAPEKLRDLPTGYREVNAEGDIITDETYMYDSNGNVIRSYDAVDGRVVETTYYEEDDAAAGKIKGEIKSEREYFLNDSANQSSTETTYSYDSSGKKTEVTTEKSGQYTVTTTTVYDVMGREISSTDTLGTTTTIDYDPFGRISKITAKQGNITDVVTREYDNNGTMIKETDEDGTVYTYTYDNMNRVIKEGIQKGDLSKTWTTDYSYGSVAIDTGKGKKKNTKHVLITTEKNPNGDILEETYADTYGKIIRQKKNGLYVDYTYDRENHVLVSCQLGTNPENTDPIVTAYLYDKNGNASGQILNPEYSTEAKTFVVTKDSLTQNMTYDSTGNVITSTDGEGNTISYTYDAYGRITSVTQPSVEGEAANVTRYKYDEFDSQNKNGNTLNTVTDALGRTSVTTYNMAMQPVSVFDRGDGTVTAISQNYTYDSKGRVSEQKGSLGTSVTYDYDGKDRVTAKHYKNASGAEELRTSYTYDKSDNITSMTDYKVSGGTASPYRYTEYKYDRLKRMTSLTELNTSKEPSAVTAAEKEAATTKYSYDIDGNLLTVTYPQSDWKVTGLKYEYDQNKWLKTIKAVMKDGKEATLRTYAYDEYGSVADITDYRVLSKTGELVSNPQSTVCHYAYDICRRPVSMTYTDSEASDLVKEAYTYSYDKNSRLVRETLQNLYPEKEEDRQDEVHTYQYDVRGNLIRTEVENQLDAANSYVLSYTYDAVGNRLKQERSSTLGTLTTNYSYNSLNQLLNSDTKDANGTAISTKAYAYDANGNQVRETDSVSKKETLNTYDSVGRLSVCTITEDGKQKVQQTNQYNGAGNRIQKTEDGKTTNYYYSNGGVLYTTDGKGKGTSLNLQGASGNIIATARKEDAGEGYYYYHKDPAGSTTNLRDADGKSVVSYQYTDFGETSIHGDTDFYNEICYNETIYDKSTGLYYLSARYYNPEDGRFISRDSYRGDSAKPSTWNLYVYCANSPVNYEDPSGHIAISRIVGGVVGGAVGFWAGRKIAKKTKAKGWKKVAIVAGCTVGGAVVGAIAGPRVAKVAKKAVSYVRRKIPSRGQISRTLKTTAKKAKSGVKKAATKTRQVISKGKSSTIGKVAGRTAKGSLKGAGNSAIQNGSAEIAKKGTSQERYDRVKKSIISGAVGGAISGGIGGVTEAVGVAQKGLGKGVATVATGIASGIGGSLIIDDNCFVKSAGFGAAQELWNTGFGTLTNGLESSVVVGYLNWLPDFAMGFISSLL